MAPEVNFSDTWHHGFETGLKYALTFVETATKHRLTNTDIMILANLLETERPWRSAEDWYLVVGKERN